MFLKEEYLGQGFVPVFLVFAPSAASDVRLEAMRKPSLSLPARFLVLVVWACGWVPGVLAEPIFTRGDANSDAAVNISDTSFILSSLFAGHVPAVLWLQRGLYQVSRILTHLTASQSPPAALRRLPDAKASRFTPRLPGTPICRHEMGEYPRDLVLPSCSDNQAASNR